MEADASQKGIGSIMLQPDKKCKNTSTTEIPNNLRLVAYASKTLTSCESNYSNIERELLGVLFSILHFKHFTYECKVHIITDHKPLVSLFRKSLTSTSPRLSRMLLHILDYQLDVMYQPGTKMHLSDALSRLTSHNNNNKAEPIRGLDVTVHDVQIFTEILPLSLAKIKCVTENDPDECVSLKPSNTNNKCGQPTTTPKPKAKQTPASIPPKVELRTRSGSNKKTTKIQRVKMILIITV